MDHVRRVKNKVLDFQAAFLQRRRSSTGSVGSETETTEDFPAGISQPKNKAPFPSDSGDFSRSKSKAPVTLADVVRRVDPSQYYRNYPCGNEIQIRDWDTW